MILYGDNNSLVYINTNFTVDRMSVMKRTDTNSLTKE